MAFKFRTKQWAVMMFIANDNNLGAFTKQKLREIESVGSTTNFDVIVQFDTPGISFIRRFRLSEKRKFRLRKLQKETNTGDRRTLIRFADLTLEDFHPIRKMLVISNHGTGLSIANDEILGRRAPIFRNAVRRRRGLLANLDQGTQPLHGTDSLDDLELKSALKSITTAHGRLELLLFDACLMSTIEVAYQLRETARFMVASQSNIPIPGCRFAPTLNIMRDPAISNASIAESLVTGNVTPLVADEYSAMAALDLDQASAVAKTISNLATALTNALGDDDAFEAISIAHLSALAFLDSETIDLFDFCHRLASTVNDPAVRSAANAVLARSSQFVVSTNPRGAVVQGAGGVAITLPRKNLIPDAYRQLDFARETSWLSFLESYLGRRFPAPAEEPAGILGPAPSA
jgi:cysteine peptidase C11 family protein